MNKEILIMAAMVWIVALSACDSGSDGPNEYTYRSVPGLDTTLSEFHTGSLSIVQASTIYKTGLQSSDSVHIDTIFYRDVNEPKIAELQRDRCSYVHFHPLFLGNYYEPISRDISAGEPITVSSPNGTYASLLPYEHSIGRYGIDMYNAGLVPKRLSMSIPGAEFPAIPHIDVPDLAPLELLQPTAPEEITLDTVYRWVPGSDESSHIVLTSFGTTLFSSFSCYIRDDGEFRLPKKFAAKSGNAVEWEYGNIKRVKIEFHEIRTGAISIRHESKIYLYNHNPRD